MYSDTMSLFGGFLYIIRPHPISDLGLYSKQADARTSHRHCYVNKALCALWDSTSNLHAL